MKNKYSFQNFKLHWKLLIAIALLNFLPPAISAQKEANNWLFGDKAGITFNTPDGKPICLSGSSMSTLEGVASVSDSKGNLLFYTDGQRVWNGKNQRMKEGKNLSGNYSSTQSAIIVRKPGIGSLYYIFTIDAQAREKGLQFSIVDMSMDNGGGDVSVKNIPMLTPVSEKIVAARHRNGKDIWIIAHEWGTDAFYSFLLTSDTLETPVVSHTGSVHQGGYDNGNSIGYMKISQDFKRLALSFESQRKFEMFDFDNSAGKVSNPKEVSYPSSNFGFYGIEFSSDGTMLFVPMVMDSTNQLTGIYRFDLEAADIKSSAELIGSSRDGRNIYALQAAPDGNIYVAVYGSKYLGLIENPAKKVPVCKFVEQAVDLCGATCYNGLPNFFTAYLESAKCAANSFDNINMYDIESFALVGSARSQDSVVRLTETKNNTTGVIWRIGRLPIRGGFTVEFKFRMSGGFNDFSDGSSPGADGVAFVIQNNHQAAFGSNGGGIGYSGIPDCFAIEFDTYRNDFELNDPDGNHIAVFAGKQDLVNDHKSKFLIAESSNLVSLKADSTVYYVKIEYNIQPNKLKVYIDTNGAWTNPSLAIDKIDLDSLINLTPDGEAFAGITSATGNSYEIHDLLSWKFCAVKFDNTTGIPEDISENPFQLAPNPFQNKFDIIITQAQSGSAEFQIFDALGTKIKEISYPYYLYDNQRITFELANIPSGIYFLKAKTGGRVYISKLIKY